MKRRRLTKSGPAAFTLIEDEEGIVRAFDALRRFRTQRFKERRADDLIDHNAVFSFYRQVAIEGARTGMTRTFGLYLAGELIAVMFGLVHRATFSLVLAGYDILNHSRLSPGLLATEDTLRASVERGDHIFDFTIGDHPYKLEMGGKLVPLYEWHRARSVRGYLAVLGIEAMREAKRVLKPLLRGEPRQARSTPVPSGS
jgi:CelD/BcsL family acetyltransferase involved in cellulose biosynthesis